MPYSIPDMALRTIPDSLTPIFVNHVGRHGSRYMSSDKYTSSMLRLLHRADSLGTITPEGRKLADLCKLINTRTAGRWGALDSLGMAEQRGIASRLYTLLPALFSGTKIHAIASHVPRCIASMSEFTHQLSRLDNNIEIYTSSGRQNSPLLRPWTSNEDYEAFIGSDSWKEAYNSILDENVSGNVAARVLGQRYPLEPDEQNDVAATVRKIVASCGAMSIDPDAGQYMTVEESNVLWSVDNIDHYLKYSASTLSASPAEIASALLNELIATMDEAAHGSADYSVMLRFGHAETLMPLLSLMHTPGCYYMTNYFDTVALHWKDFYIVPMAANLQMILFKSSSGRLYVRTDLNEIPVPLIPGRNTIYTPWETAKEYLTRCLPFYLQP